MLQAATFAAKRMLEKGAVAGDPVTNDTISKEVTAKFTLLGTLARIFHKGRKIWRRRIYL